MKNEKDDWTPENIRLLTDRDTETLLREISIDDAVFVMLDSSEQLKNQLLYCMSESCAKTHLDRLKEIKQEFEKTANDLSKLEQQKKNAVEKVKKIFFHLEEIGYFTKCDYHTHIGQWHEKYYSPQEVLDAVFKSEKVQSIVYSSTTSEVFLPPLELYEKVTKEIKETYAYRDANYPQNYAGPLFWVVPEYIDAGITIEKAFSDVSDYIGFKLHPYGNKWNFENDKKQDDFLKDVFAYANKNRLMILIHTGGNDDARPSRFEKFFDFAPNAKIILAHARPLDEAIEMLEKHPHIFCDSAFVSEDDLKTLCEKGFSARIFYGTDFPITHYFECRK